MPGPRSRVTADGGRGNLGLPVVGPKGGVSGAVGWFSAGCLEACEWSQGSGEGGGSLKQPVGEVPGVVRKGTSTGGGLVPHLAVLPAAVSPAPQWAYSRRKSSTWSLGTTSRCPAHRCVLTGTPAMSSRQRLCVHRGWPGTGPSGPSRGRPWAQPH